MPRARLPRPAGLLLAAAVLALAACGGGGGAAKPTADATPVLDLGELASTIPSSAEALFPSPLSSGATVTASTFQGPFRVDPADLPAAAPGGGDVPLGVLHDALGEGPVTGLVTLVFEGSRGSTERTYELRARGEVVSFTLLTSTLDFGAVEVGEILDLQAQALNLSDSSPVTFTSAVLPGPDFQLVGDPFPLTVEPGNVATVQVRYAPLSAGTDDGDLVLGPLDPGGNLSVPVVAATVGEGAEEIIDFGRLDLDGSGRTPTLSVSVPADAISLTLEGSIDSFLFGSLIGLDLLEGPAGKVYENPQSTGDYIWTPGTDVFATQVPNTDQATLQLVPGGGTYRFALRKLQGVGSRMDVRAIVERRPGGVSAGEVLDLNVWLANGIPVSAATAATDADLQAVLVRIDQILSGQGLSVGDVDYYDVTDPAFDDVTTQSEFSSLLELSAGATEVRLNLFFVNVAFGGGVVGVAAAVDGPKMNGTSASGVMSVYSGFSTSTIGLIAAHEIGHFIGLYHTVEQNGSHDFIDDTLDCPASGTDNVCTTPGGGYLMHWQAVGGSALTNGQGLVIRGHPLVAPTPGGAAKMRVPPPPPTPFELGELLSLPDHWCATCAACRERKGR